MHTRALLVRYMVHQVLQQANQNRGRQAGHLASAYTISNGLFSLIPVRYKEAKDDPWAFRKEY